MPVVPPRVTVRAGRDESDVAPGLTGATSESSSHRLPSVKSAPCRSVSASANDHRLLTQTCDASPYRGMLRVGAWCSNRGTPAGRTKLLLRFGLGLPVFPCTRSTPCRPHWQGPSCAGSRTRLRTSFALFSALMAGTRLRGDHGCRGVVRGRVGEEGVVIGGLRRAGACRRAGSSRVTGNRLRCAAIETPTHRTSWCDPPCPDRVEPSHTVQDPTAARCRHGHPVPGVGASSRDGYLRAPSPSSRRAAGRVGVSHATARPSGAPAAAPLPGDQRRAGSGGHPPASTNARQDACWGLSPVPDPGGTIHTNAPGEPNPVDRRERRHVMCTGKRTTQPDPTTAAATTAARDGRAAATPEPVTRSPVPARPRSSTGSRRCPSPRCTPPRQRPMSPGACSHSRCSPSPRSGP